MKTPVSQIKNHKSAYFKLFQGFNLRAKIFKSTEKSKG